MFFKLVSACQRQAFEALVPFAVIGSTAAAGIGRQEPQIEPRWDERPKVLIQGDHPEGARDGERHQVASVPIGSSIRSTWGRARKAIRAARASWLVISPAW